MLHKNYVTFYVTFNLVLHNLKLDMFIYYVLCIVIHV